MDAIGVEMVIMDRFTVNLIIIGYNGYRNVSTIKMTIIRGKYNNVNSFMSI